MTGSPRLGRGLASLLGEKSSSPLHARAGIQFLPVEALEPSQFQPRGTIKPESLSELVASVRTHGILQPLLARPHPTQQGRFQIIAGERRWRAAQAAELHELPVLVRDLSDFDGVAAALIENLQRLDLDPIEEADGYRRLISDFGLTQEGLADAVGRSRSHVANTLRLLNLPPSVQTDVRRGALSAGHARALLSHPEPVKAAMTVIARGLNVRQTEALGAGRVTSDGDGSARVERDPELDAVARQLTERTGLKVEIIPDQRGGTVRIRYRTLEQLDGLATLLAPPG